MQAIGTPHPTTPHASRPTPAPRIPVRASEHGSQCCVVLVRHHAQRRPHTARKPHKPMPPPQHQALNARQAAGLRAQATARKQRSVRASAVLRCAARPTDTRAATGSASACAPAHRWRVCAAVRCMLCGIDYPAAHRGHAHGRAAPCLSKCERTKGCCWQPLTP